MKLEHAVKVTHFKDSTNPRPRYHYAQVTVEQACSLQRTDNHPESK